VYLAVLAHGRAGVSTVAADTKMNRRNIYDTVNTLLDKGLLFEIVGERERHLVAVSPEKLMEMVEAKEIILASVMPHLRELYHQDHVREGAVMYKGAEGYKQYLQNILNVRQDVYRIGIKHDWEYGTRGEFGAWFTRELHKRNIRVRRLVDGNAREEFMQSNVKANFVGEYRFLPKEYTTPAIVDVFGDHTVAGIDPIIESFESAKLYVMVSRELADAWRVWFRFMWDVCSLT